MAAVFACIVQPKVIEFNMTDQKLHRAQKDEELRSELDALKLPSSAAAAAGPCGPALIQPGGGCRVLSRSASVSVASVGSAVCVFEGTLINAGTLAEDYAPLPEEEPTPAPTALSTAELLCHLYSKVGVEMLGLLRGSFTFVLYESKTSRVLAARDGGGRSPLFQARSARGSLVLSNSAELLQQDGCSDQLEFQPGDYKYGWSATPRRYQPAEHARLSRRSLEHPAAASSAHYHHLSQHHQGQGQGGSRNGSRRSSLDNSHHHNNNNKQQQQANGAGGGCNSPQQSHPHPHRTYVVSAEDPRVVKAPASSSGRQGQIQQQPQTAAVAASGAWTASASAGRPKSHGAPGEMGAAAGPESGGRGGSARGGHGPNRRRSSMDQNHGGWRLGTGQGVSSAAAAAVGKETQPQLPSGEERQQLQPQTGPKQPQQPQGRGRSKSGRNGRSSLDERTPGKQQQQNATTVAGQAGTGASGTAADTAGTALRVDAPEFVCTRAAAAAVMLVGVGVGVTPAAAVVSAP